MIKSSKLAKLLLAIGSVSIALVTGACNTVKGVGQDIQSVGQAGDDAIHGK